MATKSGDNLQSLIYSNEGGPKLQVLDQLLVPKEKVYIDIPSVEAAWAVIRSMQIRGAPLIAIVACLGLAVDLASNSSTVEALSGLVGDGGDADVVVAFVATKIEYLKTSRPTAVNLFNALDELSAAVLEAAAQTAGTGENSRPKIVAAVIAYAEMMLRRDVADNKAIGSHGAEALLSNPDICSEDERAEKKIRLMTICNTGSLATAGYGTALGVARALQALGKLESITALETRPYNQGSRLTAFEIMEEQMPGGTLICDSAAAAMMRIKGVDACVVGADRVCANGDTANKIGTYNLAIVAAAHGVPFYVASPFTTLDTKLASGDAITIEERPPQELLASSNAPDNMNCWNPAFDVTPAKYIAGIITEKGIITKAPGAEVFDVASFMM
uniref:Methylthioribose-1-phosphate isomerase n=1 Tax=Attheya septentrionalis TaxID=420275 RepID=A0A7S2XN47_9STRA|mmetsp:Transcript_22595/g.40778  ORF Transcript_22595/g.40778 Transcript_22595/m.40778 type:complete len:388 (+) Transcript_22595:54-1217(+)